MFNVNDWGTRAGVEPRPSWCELNAIAIPPCHCNSFSKCIFYKAVIVTAAIEATFFSEKNKAIVTSLALSCFKWFELSFVKSHLPTFDPRPQKTSKQCKMVKNSTSKRSPGFYWKAKQKKCNKCTRSYNISVTSGTLNVEMDLDLTRPKITFDLQ